MAFEDGVFPTFYDDVIQNKRATKEEGYPVFDEVLMIKIQVPNQVDCVPRPATDDDKRRFPKSWQAYETGKEPEDDGFLISAWGQVSATERKILDANQIKTVEQLAEVADSGIHRLGPGGQGLKNRAKKFLEGNGVEQDLRARIKELESKLAVMEAPQQAKKERKVIKM